MHVDPRGRVGVEGGGWPGACPQLWLGNVSCLLARGVINNRLHATGSTEASQGAAWCRAGAQPSDQWSCVLGNTELLGPVTLP